MKYTIKHGGEIEVATPKEVDNLIRANQTQPLGITKIRAGQVVVLDDNGDGVIEAYKVPTGGEFALRRVALNLSTASDPSTGNVPLNVAGHYVAYYRSGTFVAYAIPEAPTGVAQVPGVEEWSEQQGPYLKNSEVLEIQAVGLTANAVFTCEIQGLLYGPAIKR